MKKVMRGAASKGSKETLKSTRPEEGEEGVVCARKKLFKS